VRPCIVILIRAYVSQDLTPPINPPKEIDDPTDSKPADWVDEATIDDPDAKKPDGRAHAHACLTLVMRLWSLLASTRCTFTARKLKSQRSFASRAASLHVFVIAHVVSCEHCNVRERAPDGRLKPDM
jgi:hypothetical protein